jgi:S-adenosylmethionine uptake transporter
MGLHVLRAGLTAGMSTLYFDGVVRMPLAQAMALSFVAPLIALYLAALTLGERLRPRAVVGSLVALAGVGVIAADELGHAPGGDGWRGLIEILVSAVLYAFTLVLQRRQAQVATPVEVAFFQSILVALILLPLALVWAPWPAPFAWGLVALGAVLAVASMMLLAWAYARAEAQVLVPLEYTAFIWAALVGWLAFAEPLTRGTLGGVVLIVAGCVFATRRGSGEGTKAPGPTALEGMPDPKSVGGGLARGRRLRAQRCWKHRGEQPTPWWRKRHAKPTRFGSGSEWQVQARSARDCSQAMFPVAEAGICDRIGLLATIRAGLRGVAHGV